MRYDRTIRRTVYSQWKELKLKFEERLTAKTGWPELTLAVQMAHDPAKFYHYANEADMLNRIVTGMSAKKFKALHDVESVRDTLAAEDIELLNKLQKLNTSLIELEMSSKERKSILTEYADKHRTKRLT